MVLQALSALMSNPMGFGRAYVSYVLAAIAVWMGMDFVTTYVLPFQSVGDAVARLPGGIGHWLTNWLNAIRNGLIQGSFLFLLSFYPNGLL